MSLMDRLRNLIAGPSHVEGGGDPEAEADLHEEYGAADPGEADLERMAQTGGGGGSGIVPASGLGAAESAEAAEAEIQSEEAPPDPNP